MKYWKMILIVVLLVTNVTTIIFLFQKEKDLQFVRDDNRAIFAQIDGSNNKWELIGGSLRLLPNHYIVDGGVLTYKGKKSIEVSNFKVEISQIKKDGSKEVVLVNKEDFDKTLTERISLGYINDLGSISQTLGDGDFQKISKEANGGKFEVSIFYQEKDKPFVTEDTFTTTAIEF